MCTTSLDAGDKFRDEIVGAVKACKVFVPLINNEWAASGECYDEFSLAKRRNLTSHESGRTSPSGPRLPAIVPVAFPSLDWERFPHVELLAATTNFLLSSTEDVAEDNPVIESVRKWHRLQFVSTLIHHPPPSKILLPLSPVALSHLLPPWHCLYYPCRQWICWGNVCMCSLYLYYQCLYAANVRFFLNFSAFCNHFASY